MKSYDDLSAMHIDVIKEIGNIGSGSAATALSQMLGKMVDISVPEIEITTYAEAYEKLGGMDSIKVGIILGLKDGISGMMMFLLPTEVACNLLNTLMMTDIKDYSEIDEIGFSAIGEMANIMSASFVNAIAVMTGLSIDISPPSATIDMLGAIMSVPAIHFAKMGDKLMYIKNELEISGKRTPANIMLLPDAESLVRLMSSLGVDI